MAIFRFEQQVNATYDDVGSKMSEFGINVQTPRLPVSYVTQSNDIPVSSKYNTDNLADDNILPSAISYVSTSTRNTLTNTLHLNESNVEQQVYKDLTFVPTDLSNLGTLPVSAYGAMTIVTSGSSGTYIYYIGGQTGGTYAISATYYAPILSNGIIGQWNKGTNLPVLTSYCSLFHTSTSVYLLGGQNGPSWVGCYLYAPINDGIIGTWSSLTVPFVSGLGAPFQLGNYFYAFAGFNGSAHTGNVYVASVTGNGQLGSWTATGALPSSFYSGTVAKIGGSVYVFDGYNGTAYTNTVYTAPITAGVIGAWSSFTVPITYPSYVTYSSIVTNNRIYIIGGYNGTSSINTISSAPITGAGTTVFGTWTTSVLPSMYELTNVFATSKYIYLLGNYNNVTASNAILYQDWSGGANGYTNWQGWSQQNGYNSLQTAPLTAWKQGYQLSRGTYPTQFWTENYSIGYVTPSTRNKLTQLTHVEKNVTQSMAHNNIGIQSVCYVNVSRKVLNNLTQFEIPTKSITPTYSSKTSFQVVVNPRHSDTILQAPNAVVITQSTINLNVNALIGQYNIILDVGNDTITSTSDLHGLKVNYNNKLIEGVIAFTNPVTINVQTNLNSYVVTINPYQVERLI